MRYTVVYGGSFNPVHRGHVAAASMIAADPEVARVIVVPAACHPDKSNLVDFEIRYWLLKLAMPEDNKLIVSRAEKTMLSKGNEGPVYTYNLLTYLSETYNDLKFAVGPDLIEAPTKWYLGDRVAEEFGFYMIPSFGPARSTLIRERVQAGLPIDNYTPSSVAREIEELGLYKDG